MTDDKFRKRQPYHQAADLAPPRLERPYASCAVSTSPEPVANLSSVICHSLEAAGIEPI